MDENPIAEVIDTLKADHSSPDRRYPDQALYALQDPKVREGIVARFEQGAILAGIKALAYDFFTGLNRIYFEFAEALGAAKSPEAILVILDADCKVVGVVDPFNPVQPNRIIAPLPDPPPDLPFVLSQPSASGSTYFTKEDLEPGRRRAEQFFAAISPNGVVAFPTIIARLPIGGGGGGGGDGCFAVDSTCTGTSHSGAMVCLEVTGFWFPACDAWDWQTVPDTVYDDCGEDIFGA